MADAEFLDGQYLRFLAATDGIWERYPALAGLRYPLFKTLLVRGQRLSLSSRVARVFRAATRVERSALPTGEVDVLILVETGREVVSGALLPVHGQLKQKGLRSVLLTAGAGSPPNAEDVVTFRSGHLAGAPAWSRSAWRDLRSVIPALGGRRLEPHFFTLAAAEQARRDELSRVIERLAPGVVVSAATNLPGGAQITSVAREAGIPTVLMQHGIPQAFYLPLMASHTLAWGRSSVEVLHALGERESALHAVGSPRHDPMPRVSRAEGRAALQRALELPDRPTLAFFSNGNDLYRNGAGPEGCARWLEQAAEQLAGTFNIVVRLHPNEDGSLYRDTRYMRLSKHEVDLEVTLAGCDVAASLCSTVLYDALLFDKPVWQFHADGWPDLADNWRHGLAKRVVSAHGLVELLTAFRADQGVDTPGPDVVESVFANHGEAAGVAADFIAAGLSE